MEQRKIYRVSEAVRLIRTVLEDEIGEIWVEGEISEARPHASGHLYLTIRDANSELKVVMFRSDRAGLRFEPRAGMLVRVMGAVTVYEARGQVQIRARRLEPCGSGALAAAFEALKARLGREGLFDQARKRPLPLLPRHIGLVTSPSGAAIHDILKVLSRRFHNLHLVLAPARVQGDGAAAEIAAALDLLNARGGLDVIIVGRGGGSPEDLWAFNEEAVARAIARSGIPVISAVGHETDFTISDFVADLRAPTPSAAAEMVVGRKEDFERRLADAARRLRAALDARMAELRGRFAAASRSYVFREPSNLAKRCRELVRRLGLELARGLEGRMRDAAQRLDEAAAGLVRAAGDRTLAARSALRECEAKLAALNPLAVLARGYSITSRAADGALVRRAADAGPGSIILTRVAEGRLESEVRSAYDCKDR